MDNKFSYDQYLVRQKIISVLGARFHIYNANQELVMYSQMKAFKLKEDIRLYSDESMSEELLTIKARNVIDFSATYDVQDARTGERVGSLRRKGFKSILKDEWIILNAGEAEIGRIKEDSRLLALLRRFLSSLIPQTYNVEINGITVTTFKQNFNPFVTKINVDFSSDPSQTLDRRLGLAASVLLCAIDGKQSS
ncbi:hypothetical protein MKX50_06195 [Paenibacillus sp. FSL W8-0186]|uniref:Uncharacterized protein n=1 Tax=Paenibacillus woosongensis TaxID=307580 RepID=A0ABQ4MUP1_9BACL|nr:hypothetical protein [Paenibacillus woosongensis]GIP59631.1 hypothetical protein J15TS10_34450 [Paenibacillus woosongensis]